MAFDDQNKDKMRVENLTIKTWTQILFGHDATVFGLTYNLWHAQTSHQSMVTSQQQTFQNKFTFSP